MKKHIFISLAAIILSLTGCVKPDDGGKDNPPAPQEQIIIPSTVDVTPVVPPEGGDTKISFTAAAAWTASVISTKADSWVDVSPKSGNPGAAEIKITVTPNDTYVERNATIQISCGGMTIDIVVTQKQMDNITVTTDKVELGAEGGTFTIELKSNIDFSYEIEGDWIKYVSTKAYTDKTLTFSAEANDGVQKREGSVTVKGGEFSETVKVYQSGEEPTLIITQNEYELDAEGGSIVVEVSSNVAVNMIIPEEAGWITENSTKSVSTSTFHLDVAANETNESRSTEIMFSNEESGLSEKITVSQKGKIYVPVTDMVDLGLSVKWATCNIGASKPEEYGGYYQWAGLEDVTSTDISIGFDENQGIHNCPYHKEGSDYSTGWTKYVQSERFWSGTGSPDYKTVLDPEDDIAYMTLGGKWRMPTDAEWTELRENCTWTWTDDYNGTGIAGRIVTSNMPGYTDKSIFLPAAGYRDDVSLYSDGINGCYWSSSLESNRSYLAYWVLSYSSNVRRQNCYRFYGNSVRPVYGEKVSVTGVSIYPTSINLDIENTSSLSATVIPFNATEQGISWTSSDTDVATVDQSGKVSAVGAGNATITVKTTDGGYTATCSVTVKSSEPAVPEMVDLGLSVKWATCNIGATKPEEYGGYYQWAGLEDVTSTDIILGWDNCPYHTTSHSHYYSGWTKYVTSDKYWYWSGDGKPDNKTVLEPGDDVAHVILGGHWRMPTKEEWFELINNCTWTWTDNYNGTGVAGRIVTGNMPGYTDKSIFLPAAGFRIEVRADASTTYANVGRRGNYWSSSGSEESAFSPYFDYGYIYAGDTTYDFRCRGNSVRPVSD